VQHDGVGGDVDDGGVMVMIVLSRERNETVMIGESLLVTVMLVRGDRVTLEVEDQERSQTSTHELERDQELLLRGDCRVRVVDIRAEKVRLGVVAPRQLSVHRKEVWEALRRENATASGVRPGENSHGLSVTVGQTIVIGGTLRVRVVAIGETCAFMDAKGRLAGGPDDGFEIDQVLEVAESAKVQLGTGVSIWLRSTLSNRAAVQVVCDDFYAVHLEA
jgi:carbon storage regulator CsrA